MSRRWGRADRDMLCGLCENRQIAVGEPVLYIRLIEGRRERVRCVHCSGPAPPDLPAYVERRSVITPTPLVRMKVDMLPLDFKARGAGDRVIGEDDND